MIQAGLADPERKSTDFSVVECPRCSTINPRSQTLCTKCQSVLSLKAALALEDQLVKAREERESLEEQVQRMKCDVNMLHQMIDKIAASGGLPDWQTPEGGRQLVEHLKKHYAHASRT